MNFKTIFFTLFAFLGMQHAHAATITVTTTSDVLDSNTNNPDGVCSLREATININDQSLTYADCTDDSTDGFGTNDTIILTSGQTYTLTRTNNSSDSDEVNDLDVHRDLSLITTSTERATISANFSSTNDSTRILKSLAGNLNLENITFFGGSLDAVNYTNYSGGYGANVYIKPTSGTTTITNCSFENGSIQGGSTNNNGAGLYYYQNATNSTNTVTISNSEFSGNTITATGLYSFGAGAYFSSYSARSVSLTLDQVEFTNNNTSSQSITEGSGLYIRDIHTTTITNSHFSQNTALTIYPNGSAIDFSINNLSQDITLEIENSTFDNNEHIFTNGPTYAGSIHCKKYTNNFEAYIHIRNSTISNNINSGGIYNQNCGITISHSTIYGNSDNDAGGVYSYGGDTSLINTLIAKNTDSSGQARDCYSSTSSSGSNITFGNNYIADSTDCGLVQNSSTQNADILDQPITLASLADNGGDTDTHAFSNTPNDAIDGGTCLDVDGNPITTDQRGYPRTTDCDIGAYEQFFPDADGDLSGDESYLGDTSYSSSYVNKSGDCDDGNDDVYTGNTEDQTDGIDNDCDNEIDESESSGSGSGSNSGSGGSSNDDNLDDVTCEALTPECMGEEAYQEYLDSLEESENQAAGAGGCGCNVASQVPVSPITIFLSLGVFVSLFALRLQQKRS